MPGCVLVADDHRELPDGFIRLSEFSKTDGPVDVDSIEKLVGTSHWEDEQFICQTSGSSGLSKSAVWNHRSPLSTANFTAVAMGVDETDRYINLAPFFHNSGICVALTMCLAYAGITLYLSERFDPDAAVETIQDENITATFGFAAHWHAMHGSSRFKAGRFGITKALIAGNADLYDFVEDMCPRGAAVVGLYAQTENGPLVSCAEPGCVDRRLRRTSGRPLPGTEVEICDIDSGERLRDGESGEIRYRSPFLFRGYLNDDGDVQLPLDANGFFRSGDYGFLSGGYLTYIGRLGDMVKSGGENVSLANVTNVLTKLFKCEFTHVHAVAVPDPYWGDRVVGIVKPGSLTEWTPEELRARCKKVLAGYEVPRDFLEWTESWPTSPEGKLDTRRLQKFAAERLNLPGRLNLST